MTSTVVSILQAIDALSQTEQQELMIAICDGLRPTEGHRVTIDCWSSAVGIRPVGLCPIGRSESES
jgi:hypothetical protein